MSLIFLGGIFEDKIFWYPITISYRRALKGFSYFLSCHNLANSLSLLTILHQLLLTEATWHTFETQAQKHKKKFIHSLKVVIQFSLLYIYLCVYVQELFSVSWKNLHAMEIFLPIPYGTSCQPLTEFEPTF